MKNLTVKRIERAIRPGRYRDGTIPGLSLLIGKDGARLYVLRYYVFSHFEQAEDGKQRRVSKERLMSLGPASTLTLAEARERARTARVMILDGKDPLVERAKAKQEVRDRIASSKTFRWCAEAFHARKVKKWKEGGKTGTQWTSQMEAYVYPLIGDMFVSDIDKTHIIRFMSQETKARGKGGEVGPFIDVKGDTAHRVRGQIGEVLSFAKAQGYRDGDNPADWKLIKGAFPSVEKKGDDNHHPALPFARMPEFLRHLQKMEGTAARLLEIDILTVPRPSELRLAKWPEFDLDERIWTKPPERKGNKGSREHKVPLCDKAIALLSELPREADDGFLFVGARANRPLSDMACLKLVARMNAENEKEGKPLYLDPEMNNRVITVHGMRASFRTWAAETGQPDDIAKSALAHKLRDKVEAAYNRGSLLNRRRVLMSAWQEFCYGPVEGEKVVPIRKKAAR